MNAADTVSRSPSPPAAYDATDAAPEAMLQTITNLHATGGSLVLQERQQLRMRDARGWTVKALTGTVWITQDWDSRDIVLKPGQSFVLDRQGSALISPLGDAEICVKQEARKPQEAAAHSNAAPAASGFKSPFSAARALFA